MCSASRRCTAQCRVSKICAKRFVSPQSLPLVNLQDKPTRQRDKLARNRDSGTAKSRDACASTTFPYGLRARCEYFCSAHRGTSPAFGAAIRGAIDSWSESLRAGIACAAKRHAHSLLFSFPTPANADKPLVLSLPGELHMSRSLPTAGSRTRLRWLLATLVVASAGASGAFAQTAGCQVTYTAPTWWVETDSVPASTSGT